MSLSERSQKRPDELYDSLVNHPDLLICRWLEDTTLTFVNDAYAKFYGYKKEDLLGSKWIGFLSDHISTEVQKDIRLSREEGGVIQREDPQKASDGTIHWLRWYNQPIFDESGEIVEFQSVAIDVTSQKEAQEKLRTKSKEMNLILDNIEELIAFHNPDMSLLWVNRAYARAINKTKEELRGKMCYEAWYGLPKPCDDCPVKRAIEERRVIAEEVTVNGRIWQIKAYPVFNSSGELVGVVDLSFDSTDERMLTARLRESEERFRKLVESTDDIVFELDVEGGLTSIFGKWSEKAAFVSKDLLGKTADEILSPEEAAVHIEQAARAAKGASTSYEWSFNGVDSEHVYNILLSPISEEGSVTGVVGIGREITKLKETERALVETRDQLILSMSRLLRIKDPYTAYHQERVEKLASLIAKRMGLSDERLRTVKFASLLHDIGKIAIPADILNKPGKLNPIELGLIRQHPRSGYEILKDIDFGIPVSETVLQHHERLDGSGYPGGLRREEISFEAMIIAVADVVEAISSHRPYRAALGIDEAVSEIKTKSGILYDEDVVKVCLEILESGFSF